MLGLVQSGSKTAFIIHNLAPFNHLKDILFSMGKNINMVVFFLITLFFFLLSLQRLMTLSAGLFYLEIYQVMEEYCFCFFFTLTLNNFPGHARMQHSSVLSSRSTMDQVWHLGEPPSPDCECDGNNPDQHQHLGNSKQGFGYCSESKQLLVS